MKKFAGEERASAATGDVGLIDGRVPNRIMLLPIGALEPRDGRKPWLIEDRAHAEAIVQATQERLGKTALMIDYDHQSRRAPAVAGRAPAAGWVEPDGLSVEDDGIYGDVEWTSQARAELKDRHYRYISPDFGHRKDGRVTRIFAAALTNTPALEMSAVASQSDEETPNMDKIIQKLGLAADSDEDAIVAAIDGLQNSTSLVAIASALSLADDASAEEIATAAAAAAARPAEAIDTKPIAAALGEAEDASVEQLATAAATLKAGTIDPTKFVPIETHQALIARVAKGDEERATASVDAAIQAGKISPANRDWALDYFAKDEAGFVRFVGSAPEILKSGEEDSSTAAIVETLTDEERATCSRLGVSEEQYLKTKKELA